MKRAIVLASVLGLSLGVAARSASAVAPAAAPEKEKHDHKEGGHDHKDEHDGKKTDLGTKSIGATKVQVTLIGEVVPGKEAIFVITPKGEGDLKAIRAWVGIESGTGAIKTKAEKEGDEWHAHHEVSKPLPKKSAFWVEVETAAGKKKASFDLKA